MKSDCCGAEVCDHCYDCGSYDIRPKCAVCENFCEPYEECKPAEQGRFLSVEEFKAHFFPLETQREERKKMSAYELGQAMAKEAIEKAEHPGRWPVTRCDAIPAHEFRSAEKPDGICWHDVLETRDYILQLEARAERAEAERDWARQASTIDHINQEEWYRRAEAAEKHAQKFMSMVDANVKARKAAEKERDEWRERNTVLHRSNEALREQVKKLEEYKHMYEGLCK